MFTQINDPLYLTSDKKASVLVVDDCPPISRIIGVYLDWGGYPYACAASGREGLRLAVAQSPQTILIDVNLSDMSGFEVCQALKTDPLTRHIPVILIGIFEDDLHQMMTSSVGAAAYLQKPFHPEALYRQLEAYLVF